jgi:hypothetical protein
MAASRLIQLAEAVLKNAKQFDAYLQEHNLPTPSFEPDGPADFGALPVEQARVDAIDAARELADLLQGPVGFLRPIVRSSHTFPPPRE